MRLMHPHMEAKQIHPQLQTLQVRQEVPGSAQHLDMYLLSLCSSAGYQSVLVLVVCKGTIRSNKQEHVYRHYYTEQVQLLPRTVGD